MASCVNCHSSDVKAKGLCTNCYLYRRRTGKDRPQKVIDREIDRALEDQPQGLPWWTTVRKS